MAALGHVLENMVSDGSPSPLWGNCTDLALLNVEAEVTLVLLPSASSWYPVWPKDTSHLVATAQDPQLNACFGAGASKSLRWAEPEHVGPGFLTCLCPPQNCQ